MDQAERDCYWMEIAIQIAKAGQGAVEPNPMVGCVVVRDDVELARGFHQKFGGKHAEVEALDRCIADGTDTERATVYVNLEPCCHQGKTPPCVDRLIEARVARVVVAQTDPFPKVKGGGIEVLQQAGIQVDVGVWKKDATQLNAAYLKRVNKQRPWVIGKWAMTLDGKIASRTGDSKWISGESSRAIVHQLRGRMDAIIVGSQTAIADNPLLTARPVGPRVATRIVFDSNLTTPLNCQLVKTAQEFPTMFVASKQVEAVRRAEFESAGCEVLGVAGADHRARLNELLDELGRREMTNVLVEGGAGLLGMFLDIGEIDEVHVFVGNRLIGGSDAIPAVGGHGLALMSEAMKLDQPNSQIIDDDIYINGRVLRDQEIE